MYAAKNISAGFKMGIFFEQSGHRSNSLTRFRYYYRNMATFGEQGVAGWHADWWAYRTV